MKLKIENESFAFDKASLTFLEHDIDSVFKDKNNKTLGETLENEKYKNIEEKLNELTKKDFETPLGECLLKSKNSKGSDYKLFLNKYGDNTFCHFQLNSHLDAKGLYIWVVDGEIEYIGRCNDNFKKRVNQGYGKINPKNCFKDGQATNCHLNSKINETEKVEFWVYNMDGRSKAEIDELESKFLNEYNFDWNIQKQ